MKKICEFAGALRLNIFIENVPKKWILNFIKKK